MTSNAAIASTASRTVTPNASQASTAGPASARTAEGRRRAIGLALLVSAQFVVMLDTSIVNVALPSIQGEWR
jgi:hypothetical protein